MNCRCTVYAVGEHCLTPYTCRCALQALLPEALVPLTLLEPDGRALLCGDPKCAH